MNNYFKIVTPRGKSKPDELLKYRQEFFFFDETVKSDIQEAWGKAVAAARAGTRTSVWSPVPHKGAWDRLEKIVGDYARDVPQASSPL